jgi:hypothetical protein
MQTTQTLKNALCLYKRKVCTEDSVDAYKYGAYCYLLLLNNKCYGTLNGKLRHQIRLLRLNTRFLRLHKITKPTTYKYILCILVNYDID